MAKQTAPQSPLLAKLRADPAEILRCAGMSPDPWQAKVLRGNASRLLLCCTRQAGKSTTSAALALKMALLTPRSLTLLLSPSLRQSGELFRDKVLPQWRALGCPFQLRQPTQLELTLSNGSRVVSLPENAETIRGFSNVKLLIVDEASRVSDALYRAVRPMLAVSRGHLVALSTPFGKRGWYFNAWTGKGRWEKVKITADECPRIAKEFLAEERLELGERFWRQEYFCSFEDSIMGVFDADDIKAMFSDDVVPFQVPGL